MSRSLRYHEPTNDQAQTSPLGWQQQSRTLRALSSAVRLTIVACVAWIGFVSASSIYRLLAPESPAAPMDQTQQMPAGTPALPLDIIMSLPVEGHWTFAGWNWRIGRTDVAADELDRRFGEVGRGDSAPVSIPTEAEQELIAVLRQISPNVQPRDGREVFYYDSTDARLQVVAVQVKGSPRLHSAALALRQSESQWLLWELLPAQANTDGRREFDQTHLLPLPTEAKQILARRSRDDELMLELVTMVANPQTLIGWWEQLGWNTQHLTRNSEALSLLCAHSGTQIYAWSPNTGTSVRSLVMVRIPEQVKPSGESVK